MQPRDAFEAAARERFVQEPPFSTILTGIADFTGVMTRTLAGNLPFFELGEKTAESDGASSSLPDTARGLLSYVRDVEHIASLVAWRSCNRQQFVDGWNALKGVAHPDGAFPAHSLEGKLALLEAALEKAAPLDELAKALKDAATEAEKWLVIHTHQLVREEIADALEPLKDLRTLVATETASSISALSARMKSVLDRIHFKERLSFEDAALSKKSVQVSQFRSWNPD
jgi:hypothetical protein